MEGIYRNIVIHTISQYDPARSFAVLIRHYVSSKKVTVMKEKKEEDKKVISIPYNIDAEMEKGRLLNMSQHNASNMARIKNSQSILKSMRYRP